MKKNNKGFTLIELMIVVAIIGILASIALPAYQDYIARSQAAEASILLSSTKVNAEDLIAFSDKFPADQAELIEIGSQVNGTFGIISGVSDVLGGTGKVVYLFNTNNVQHYLKGKSMWYERNNSGIWSCETTLETRHAPKACDSVTTAAPTGS